MISLRFDQLAALAGGTLNNTSGAERNFSGVSIDTRTLEPGQLFIAIKGDRNDGHDFIPVAVDRGAAGVLAENSFNGLHRVRGDVPVVSVECTHRTMMKLATAYRERTRAKIAAITGSNGKTTTKEFAYSLLCALVSDAYRSPGNFNNLFGLPLALFGMSIKTKAAVMELGISTKGEMTKLGQMVQPDVITITNVGPSHLQSLGTVEGVARAKLELVNVCPPEVPLIINADDPVLMKVAPEYREDFVTFAIDAPAWFRPESIEPQEGGTTVIIEGHRFILPIPGRHQVYNLLAAYATIKTLGYTFDNIDTAGIELTTAPMRGQTVTRGDVRIVADCYNANPDSVRAGLAAFFATPANGRKVVILGDMLELGSDSKVLHRKLGVELAEYEFDLAIFVGQQSQHSMRGALDSGTDVSRLRYIDSAAECAAQIGQMIQAGDLVYVKASRGVGLETVVEAIGSGEEND